MANSNAMKLARLTFGAVSAVGVLTCAVRGPERPFASPIKEQQQQLVAQLVSIEAKQRGQSSSVTDSITLSI
jgi:hypothetical protein